jgi:hypothetical protein
MHGKRFIPAAGVASTACCDRPKRLPIILVYEVGMLSGALSSPSP